MNQWVNWWAYQPPLNIAIPELIARLYSEKLNHSPLDSCRGERANPGSLEQGYFNSASLHFRTHYQELLLIFYFQDKQSSSQHWVSLLDPQKHS